MSYRSLFKNEQIYDPAIFRDSRSLHALVFRLSASRFARCPWIYLYKVRGRRAWGAVGYADRSASCVSPPYALFPFCPRSVQRRGMGKISPRLCRETAANYRTEIHRSAFAIRAACESGASSPRLWAVIRRSLSRRKAPRDDVSQSGTARQKITDAAITRYVR